MPTTRTWTGTANNDWSNSGNWTPAGIPANTDPVVIPATGSSPAISGIAVAGSLNVAADATLTLIDGGPHGPDSTLTVRGDITNAGTINLSAITHTAHLDLAATLTLSGGGKVKLADSPNNVIEATPTPVTLTNTDNAISGAGQLGNGTALSLINQSSGVINATETNNQLVLYLGSPATATNAGLIEATGNAGLLIFRTTINNTATGMIRAAGSHVDLKGATLIGGFLSSSAGGVIQTRDNSNLIQGVTNTGTIVVNDNTTLTLKGAITNLGTMAMQAAGDNTYLLIDPTNVTLAGPGGLTMSDSLHNIVQGVTAGSTLINLANLISGSGLLGNGVMTLVNAGVVAATGALNPLILNTGHNVVTNSGFLTDTVVAGLVIQNTTVDSSFGGHITATGPGAHVDLQSAQLQGGTLQTTGSGSEIRTVDRGSMLDGSGSKVSNTGTVNVRDGTSLTLLGSISNSGTILLTSDHDQSDLLIGAPTAQLSGGGHVSLTDALTNVVEGVSSSAGLANIDNIISGAGFIKNMVLVNSGTIQAIFPDHALTLSTGHPITNNGLLAAVGGTLMVKDAVTGTGSCLISAVGTLVLAESSSENAAFSGLGALELGASYSGSISGFASGDTVDLTYITSNNFGGGANNIQAKWTEGGTGGTLSIIDPSQGVSPLATLTFAGSYFPSQFLVSNDGHSHPLISLGVTTQTIQNDHLAIIRMPLALEQATTVADAINAGTQTEAQYVQQLISVAQSSTVPAVAVYDFFFGAIPLSLGIDFLTNFANQIQTPAGGGFSVINTYVNMAATDAINSNSSFAPTYGMEAMPSEMTFFNNVYNQIFGYAPSTAAINNYFQTQTFNLPNGTTITGTAFDFYREYVRESLPVGQQTAANLENGARGSVVGTLLFFAEADPSTQWAQATNKFLVSAAQNATTPNWPGYGEELIANFATGTAGAVAMSAVSSGNASGTSSAEANIPLIGTVDHSAGGGSIAS